MVAIHSFGKIAARTAQLGLLSIAVLGSGTAQAAPNRYERRDARLSLDGISTTTSRVKPGGTSNPNAPVISGSSPKQVTAGSNYDFRPTASDPNGDPLTFRVANKPAWAKFETTTGRLYGVPGLADVTRVASITIYASDGTYESSVGFNLKVVAGSPPTISGAPATSATEGAAYSFQPAASDPDGQALTFAIVNKPNWAVFNAKTGLLSGTPPAGSAATYGSIGISVTDGASTASLPLFSITVSARKNNPPVISGSPATSVQEGQAYDFRPSASDADGDALRFYVTNLPSFFSFDPATGRLSGTPPAGSARTYADVLVSVGDGKDVTFLPMFSITVTPQTSASTNTPPSISGTPPTSVTAGQAYSFAPTASDPDKQTLAFGISNRPSWAVFDSATGRLSGTPTVAGTYSNVVISVSDGVASATLPAFSINVVSANRAPTISGTPAASVTTGQSYSFQPTASDPDGQALAFGIANKPSWASFDTTTGRLSGSPLSTSVGVYSNIVISVSDGSLSATLPAFAITVSAPPTQAANLTWSAPTLNSDGTPLTNLAGYKIRYGTSPSALTQLLDVPNAGITSASVEGLTAGTWYFTVSSYTNTGVESSPTAAVSFVVQ